MAEPRATGKRIRRGQAPAILRQRNAVRPGRDKCATGHLQTGVMMKLKNTDMVEQAMTRIELIQQHLANLEDAKRYVSERSRETANTGTLFDDLVRLELTEWRNVAMWGLTLDDAERDRIKAAVHQRFLRDGMAVTHWMNGGVTPSQWFSADEEKFREMARKAFSPKG